MRTTSTHLQRPSATTLCATAVALAFLCPSPSNAQTATAVEREVLLAQVRPVDVAKAALFVANRMTLKDACRRDYAHEGLASVVARVEYAALDEQGQKATIAIATEQARTNKAVLTAMTDDAARRKACDGVASQLSDYVQAFANKHPSIISKRQ